MTTRKSIERGETVSAPLKETGVFPAMVTQMIGVGEATGALDTMLGEDRRLLRGGSGHRRGRPADAARADHDRRSSACIVGGIVIAMYMPIFSMISKLTG